MRQTEDSVIMTDSQGVIVYVNPAFERLTGYSATLAVGNRPSIVKSGDHSVAFYKKLWLTISRGEAFKSVFVNRTREGVLYYEDKTIAPVRDATGAITHYVSFGKDVTERMRDEQRLSYLAYHDALTELPNRTLFMDRMKLAVARAERNDTLVAVMFLDLDGFKAINDTLGHDVGDALLKAVSSRLLEHVRAVDSIARLGGDEFTVLIEDVDRMKDIGEVAQTIVNAIHEPFCIHGHQIRSSTSVGISVYPTDGADPQTLLKNADTAMYYAKTHGKNTYYFYSVEQQFRD